MDLTPKQIFLKHQHNSLVKIDLSDTPPITRRVLGSVRRSRKTPPLKNRHSVVDIIATTPDIENPEDRIEFALAWSNKKYIYSKTEHLPSETTTPANSFTSTSSLMSLKGEALENHNVNDIIEKLQHESNIFLQADYLNYIYSTQ